MKKYAFINAARELKITYNNDTARGYKHLETDVDIYKGNDHSGGNGVQHKDGSYSAAIITGNPTLGGHELFVDRDGIRIDDATKKPVSREVYPQIAQLYRAIELI